MKTSLWDEYTPHIPEEMKYCTKQGTLEERCDWNTIARERAKEMARTIQKIDQLHDMDTSEDMLKRRIRAVVDATPGILERYRHLPGYEPELSDETGETFIQLNFIPVNTYNWQESRAYLLTAAAIWILDEILIPRDLEKRKELFRLLPRDEEILYENLCSPEFWHADYESELVDSVRYVLAYRNMDTAETEVESNKTERVVTSSLIARNAQQTETPSRQAFDRLISLIPEESIQRATAYFEELFWQWTDRLFDCCAPLDAEIRRSQSKANDLAKEFNQIRQEMIKAEAEKQKQRKANPRMQKSAALNPLLANPAPQLPDFFKQSGIISPLISSPNDPFRENLADNPYQRMIDRMDRMIHASERAIEALEHVSEALDKKHHFSADMVFRGYLRDHECREKYGDEVADRMKPLTITRPFEACFALLWLIESGSDLPWLYGCGCGLMEEVSEALPWGVVQYEELFDPVWNPEEEEREPEQLSFLENVNPRSGKAVKPSAIPEWYERKYVPDEEESFRFLRSMAQIVYEETGCILPRDMHMYDVRQKALKRYGVTGKDVTALLMMFSALGHAKRIEKALNFDPVLMEHWDAETAGEEDIRKEGKQEDDKKGEAPLSCEELVEKLKAEQERNKKLRASLHEAEKSVRVARKELTVLRENAALEHRELADLREVVFNAEAAGQEETEEPIDESFFPYEVQKATVVFGGHETWLKAIRPMLTGNIRFLDKDLNFDVNVIRNADIVWIQSNAISHPQYYRITDNARQYKKPVRYFTHASAAKGALQIVAADR